MVCGPNQGVGVVHWSTIDRAPNRGASACQGMPGGEGEDLGSHCGWLVATGRCICSGDGECGNELRKWTDCSWCLFWGLGRREAGRWGGSKSIGGGDYGLKTIVMGRKAKEALGGEHAPGGGREGGGLGCTAWRQRPENREAAAEIAWLEVDESNGWVGLAG
jgi:hypothetical protein